MWWVAWSVFFLCKEGGRKCHANKDGSRWAVLRGKNKEKTNQKMKPPGPSVWFFLKRAEVEQIWHSMLELLSGPDSDEAKFPLKVAEKSRWIEWKGPWFIFWGFILVFSCLFLASSQGLLVLPRWVLPFKKKIWWCCKHEASWNFNPEADEHRWMSFYQKSCQSPIRCLSALRPEEFHVVDILQPVFYTWLSRVCRFWRCSHHHMRQEDVVWFLGRIVFLMHIEHFAKSIQ